MPWTVWGTCMFEVQAGRCQVCAEVFSAAGIGPGRSEAGWARWTDVSLAGVNPRVPLSPLQNPQSDPVAGQTPSHSLTQRMACFSSMAQFLSSPPMRNQTQYATGVANSYYSVKMSAGVLGDLPKGNGSFSTANAPRMELSVNLSLPDAIWSDHYSDKRGLKVCR
jgi:hypothetical protein